MFKGRRTSYKVSIQDGKDWIFCYVETSDPIDVTNDEMDGIALHVGGTTIEFEGDEIEIEEDE